MKKILIVTSSLLFLGFLIGRNLIVWFGDPETRLEAQETGAPLSHPTTSPPPPLSFDHYLKTDFPTADGFDFPTGNADGKGSYTHRASGKTYNGWYVATSFGASYTMGIHPGEDWNGRGGGNTDLGQPVRSVANGKVVFASNCGRLWGKVIIIQHVFYENHLKKHIRSLYAHLNSMTVKKGEIVRRRQAIGTIGQDPDKHYPAHLHLELRWNNRLPPTYWPSSAGKDIAWIRENYANPTLFIKTHRKLFDPAAESTLILVNQQTYRMRLYQRGQQLGEYPVSFGQSKGRKRVQGDNKTPKGMYFVIKRHRGSFGGEYGVYYGKHWIKINYPNRYDAAWGKKNGIISEKDAAETTRNWQNRKPTAQHTRLGGGIGFHGWISTWDEKGPRHLSWGCIVMQNRDIARVFENIPEKTMVIIY